VVCTVAGFLDVTLRELVAAGWSLRQSLAVEPSPWGRTGSTEVCTAEVTTSDQIGDVAELLARGISVAIEVLERSLAADLYDQCARLATAEWCDDAHPPLCIGLDAVQIGLLVELSRGADVAAAARTHHLSERTAARRLATAREQLGCRSTAEAAARVAAHLARLRPAG
jgi:DNA-binding NarL/FixJ family response regulator